MNSHHSPHEFPHAEPAHRNVLRGDCNPCRSGTALPQPRPRLQRRLRLGLRAAAHARQGHGWSLQRLQEGNLGKVPVDRVDHAPKTRKKYVHIKISGIYGCSSAYLSIYLPPNQSHLI